MDALDGNLEVYIAVCGSEENADAFEREAYDGDDLPTCAREACGTPAYWDWLISLHSRSTSGPEYEVEMLKYPLVLLNDSDRLRAWLSKNMWFLIDFHERDPIASGQVAAISIMFSR